VVEKVLEMRLFTLIQIPLPPPHSFPRAHRYESYDLSEVQRAADPEARAGRAEISAAPSGSRPRLVAGKNHADPYALSQRPVGLPTDCVNPPLLRNTWR
jgi:hypothetical protein